MVLPCSDEAGSSAAGMMGLGGGGAGLGSGGDNSEPGTISEGMEGSGKRQTELEERVSAQDAPGTSVKKGPE